MRASCAGGGAETEWLHVFIGSACHGIARAARGVLAAGILCTHRIGQAYR